ncbi:DUF1801 domain-containing protein [Sphingopyxis macrogoltabida]|uniref:YdhG-like domain-containing protein n=1 Tax=Sphingopyxis macrogoltabida TaxID=33050 RepID=A0A0N9UYS4_SPHMC|nr:DUF1801 domain-containing protein [Sphingopyxis macrogoltabida]ALH80732.1 hypothetical protein AN936_10225 [Sphingopyxis macrogoltabida]
MTMGRAAESPDAYIAALSGWQRERCEMMRSTIMTAAPFAETIKWTNLVFLANGPCILIRAEESRVLLGFWRGKRLRDIEPRIKASGKYELGNLVLTVEAEVSPAMVTQLASEAFRLNAELGNPAARA